MDFEFLSPIQDYILAHIQLLPKQTIGKNTLFHTQKTGIPDLQDVQIAIINIDDENQFPTKKSQTIRLELYKLFCGNWNSKLADLGNIKKGATPQDTHFAIKELITHLIKNNIIPILIGKNQDITYLIYRAYDNLKTPINLVTIDHKFDFGDAEELISSTSYMSKIIVEKPNNLFNFSNLGYQTYYNAQEEIDLIEKLFFDAYRLGELTNNITIAEPVLRDAHILSLDMNAVKASEIGRHNTFPNGLTSREICTLARYAGISDNISSFGIFQYQDTPLSHQLIAQIIWYFLEGYNLRLIEEPFTTKKDYTKYIVPTKEAELCFYKSNKTQRWWIQIPQSKKLNNKLKRLTLLPCTQQDYIDASHQKIPNRWWKAYKRTSNIT